jgi:hypothetical protein
MSSCVACRAEYDAATVALPALTCSDDCLRNVAAMLDGYLANETAAGPHERAAARLLMRRRMPPVRPHYWMARSALVLARYVDRGASERWPMLATHARGALAHALDNPGAQRSVLDRIRAKRWLQEVERWGRQIAYTEEP